MRRKPVKSKPIHGVDELSDDSVDYFLNVESVSAIKAEKCQRKIMAVNAPERDKNVVPQLIFTSR